MDLSIENSASWTVKKIPGTHIESVNLVNLIELNFRTTCHLFFLYRYTRTINRFSGFVKLSLAIN